MTDEDYKKILNEINENFKIMKECNEELRELIKKLNEGEE